MKRRTIFTLCFCIFFAGTLNAQVYLVDGDKVGIKTAAPEESLHLDGGSFLQTPTNPTLIGSMAIGGYPQNAVVSGGYAYVGDYTNHKLMVIDVSNPAAPETVGDVVVGAQVRRIAVSGRYAYAVNSGSDDLVAVDISDPSHPSIVGTVSLGTAPRLIAVAGCYAYVEDGSSLRVVDVSNPTDPIIISSLSLGGVTATALCVSGRYAYVVEVTHANLMVIDIADPSSPVLVGTLDVGEKPKSLFVSGRYAYVVDFEIDSLTVIDVSDPSSPALVGSLAVGASPESVFVSGQYAYVVDAASDDLKMIDVSDPSSPVLVGSLYIGGGSASVPHSVFVSGRYAYVTDTYSYDLKVIDVSGAEVTALKAHSLEAGNLQVLGDVFAQGRLQVLNGINAGPGGFHSDGPVSLERALHTREDKVGIGTPDPQQRLHIHEDSSSYAYLSFTNETTGDNIADGVLVGIDPSENFRVHTFEDNNISFYIDNDHKLTIDPDGDVGIGTTTPVDDLEIVRGYTYSKINAGDTSFTTSSSKSYKENIRPLDKEDILEKIANVPVNVYDFKASHCSDGENCKDKMGLIAEEFHTIFQRGSQKEINGQEVQMALWMAVQHLYAQNKALNQKIQKLEGLLMNSSSNFSVKQSQ